MMSLFYTGKSMAPTLKTGELLEVWPYSGRKIQPGDVIVFFSPQDQNKVIHRVISVDSQGIRTQGDHNSGLDRWFLSPEQILGQVISAERQNRQRRILGGWRGRLWVSSLRTFRLIDDRISFLLHPIYHGLSRLGIWQRWLPPGLKIRMLKIQRPQGQELQLLMGQKVVARLFPHSRGWLVRRPFRLFIDGASLRQEPVEKQE